MKQALLLLLILQLETCCSATLTEGICKCFQLWQRPPSQTNGNFARWPNHIRKQLAPWTPSETKGKCFWIYLQFVDEHSECLNLYTQWWKLTWLNLPDKSQPHIRSSFPEVRRKPLDSPRPGWTPGRQAERKLVINRWHKERSGREAQPSSAPLRKNVPVSYSLANPTVAALDEVDFPRFCADPSLTRALESG